jgi:hypothetical protein
MHLPTLAIAQVFDLHVPISEAGAWRRIDGDDDPIVPIYDDYKSKMQVRKWSSKGEHV